MIAAAIASVLFMLAITAAAYGIWVLPIQDRISRIERARRAAAQSEDLKRIWRSVERTERQAAAEQALMAAVDQEPPIQLYRREGRRYVRHGDAA